MDQIWNLFIFVLVVIPVFINIVGPFIVWKTQKLPAIVKFVPIPDDVFEQQRNDCFHYYDQAIRGLGFEIVGSSKLVDSQADSYFRLYWYSALQIAAMSVTISSKIEEITYMEFSQKFADGTFLDVSNSATPESYPKLDFKSAYRFPKVARANELLAIHIKLAAGLKKSLSPVGMDVSSGFSEIEYFFRLESDALLEKGIVEADIDAHGRRQLTLYGAFVLTYKSVPPGKQIVGYLSEQSAIKTLKEVST